MLEIVAFEQQRLARRLGQGISEAVAEIELGAMISATEIDIGLARASLT
jgi:hypothetical protein